MLIKSGVKVQTKDALRAIRYSPKDIDFTVTNNG